MDHGASMFTGRPEPGQPNLTPAEREGFAAEFKEQQQQRHLQRLAERRAKSAKRKLPLKASPQSVSRQP